MARIYIGRTTGIGAFERHVVLKLILPERAEDSVAVSMFLDEARLAAMLNHQNVAQVFEVGEDGGIHYLAMEYVHGQDLRAFLAKAGGAGIRVPLEMALTVVAGAAAGLNHAHERRANDGTPLGIVHRDVSPSNIMIGYDGSVKMLDFGIAKAAQRSVETVSGIIKGKFAYMSPEQCRGREVDRRSDVFSLGIILYETTTQHRCFRADSDFDTMHRIVTGDVVKPSRLVANYPLGLEAIVLKALSVDPSQRYQSAGLLLEAIESYSLQNRSPLSTMALGRFMREMFGEHQEPWLVAGVAGVPGTVGHQASEGTISNTNDRDQDRDARYPSATEPPPFASLAAAPGATSRMSSNEIDDALRGARLAASAVPSSANQTLLDPPRREDDMDDWSRPRSYPAGATPAVAAPAVAPAQPVPAESGHARGSPRGSAPSIQNPPNHFRPPPNVTPSNQSHPAHAARPSQPPGFAQGSLPGGQFPSGNPLAQNAALAPTQLQPMIGPPPGHPGHHQNGSNQSLPLPLPPTPPPPQGNFGNTSTGSHSHVSQSQYPQLQDMEGYESFLKPGRRGLYIGIGLAAFGLIIAIAIGRSGGDGPRATKVEKAVTPDTGSSTAVAPPLPDPPARSIEPVDPTPTAATGSGAVKPGFGLKTDKPPVKPGVPTRPATGEGSGAKPVLDSPGTGEGSGTVAVVTPGEGSGSASVPTPPETGTGSGSGSAVAPTPPAPTTIKVVIKSDPSGADVVQGGKRVGKTPYEATLPIDSSSTPYTLHRDGFIDESITVKHSKDYENLIKLDKKKVASSGGSKPNTGGSKPNTGGSKPNTGGSKPAAKCQKRGAPVQPFGPKLPLCPE